MSSRLVAFPVWVEGFLRRFGSSVKNIEVSRKESYLRKMQMAF